jgi:Skp family chaperone for outer membrane proteins
MRHSSLVLALILMSSLTVFADDQQKADKEIRKITAMAWDSTGRAVVNKSLSEMLKVARPQLVEERRELNLNYGSLFIAHELALNGSNMKDIATSIKGGKSIIQVSTESNANWKQIAADAKKLNSKIEDNLYKQFLRSESEKAEYDTTQDGVKADNDVSKQDIAEAQQTYIRWRERAAQLGKHSQQTGLQDEQAIRKDRPDPVRTMPTPGMGGAAPK